jgi:hypothetical protein
MKKRARPNISEFPESLGIPDLPTFYNWKTFIGHLFSNKLDDAIMATERYLRHFKDPRYSVFRGICYEQEDVQRYLHMFARNGIRLELTHPESEGISRVKYDMGASPFGLEGIPIIYNWNICDFMLLPMWLRYVLRAFLSCVRRLPKDVRTLMCRIVVRDWVTSYKRFTFPKVTQAFQIEHEISDVLNCRYDVNAMSGQEFDEFVKKYVKIIDYDWFLRSLTRNLPERSYRMLRELKRQENGLINKMAYEAFLQWSGSHLSRTQRFRFLDVCPEHLYPKDMLLKTEFDRLKIDLNDGRLVALKYIRASLSPFKKILPRRVLYMLLERLSRLYFYSMFWHYHSYSVRFGAKMTWPERVFKVYRPNTMSVEEYAYRNGPFFSMFLDVDYKNN